MILARTIRQPAGGVRLAAWHVVFHDSRLPSVRWLAPGFRHCWPMRWLGSQWVALDAGHAWLDAVTLGADVPDLPRLLVSEGARVVDVRRWMEARLYPRGLTTCVSLTKLCLGIRAWRVVTPRQLYEWLLAEGHDEVRP